MADQRESNKRTRRIVKAKGGAGFAPGPALKLNKKA
jgi:hypothetical protein